MSSTTLAHAEARTGPKAEFFQFTNLGPLLLALLASGGLALVISLGVMIFGSEGLRERELHAWLFAFAVCFTISAGAFFWVIVHHVTDAEWSVVVRRVLENIAASFWYLWIFILPLLILAPHIYHWMTVPVGADPSLDAKRALLSRPMWTTTSLVILAYFAVVSFLLRLYSTKQDATGDPAWTVKVRWVSYISLPLFAAAITGGAIDWLMSLNAHWYSTMWGVYIFAGSAWSGMAVLILTVYALQRGGYLHHVVTVEHYHIMGKWMLAFTVFWAYIGFDQFFLYWYANIPEEAEYFVRRTTGTWYYLSIALVVLHFFVPFLLLLPRATKRIPDRLWRVAAYAVCIHLLDIYIVVVPAYDASGFAVTTFFLAAIALVAIAAPLVFLFLRNLGKQPLYPIRDPRILQSLKLVN